MKQWLKNNFKWLVGQFLIWGVPLICLIVIAINGHTQGIKIKTWVIITLVIMCAVYVLKGKKALSDVKQEQRIRDKKIAWWVYAIELVFSLIPFALGFLVIENIKESANTEISQLELFMLVSCVSMTLGYFVLISHSKDKDKVV